MYSVFEKLMKERNVKAIDVSRATGIRPSTFTDWKKGIYVPKQDKLQKIAEYFHVSIEYLLTGRDDPETIPSLMLADPVFMDYMNRLFALPQEYREQIYKQIKFQESEFEDSITEKEARSGA